MGEGSAIALVYLLFVSCLSLVVYYVRIYLLHYRELGEIDFLKFAATEWFHVDWGKSDRDRTGSPYNVFGAFS